MRHGAGQGRPERCVLGQDAPRRNGEEEQRRGEDGAQGHDQALAFGLGGMPAAAAAAMGPPGTRFTGFMAFASCS